MCGRVYMKSMLDALLREFSMAERQAVVGMANQFHRYNGAPSLYYPIIIRDVIRDPDVFGPTFVSARWGHPPLDKAPTSGRPPPVNARREGISTNGMFKDAYRSRRCLIPIDGFFEWKDIYGTGKNKRSYAVAMKTGEPLRACRHLPCEARAARANQCKPTFGSCRIGGRSSSEGFDDELGAECS